MYDCAKLVERVAKSRMQMTSTTEVEYIKALRSWRAHDCPIQCIDVDAFKITTGGTDGFIRVWDVLNATCLKSLSTKYSKHADNRRSSSQP